jgi:hypothetical protein
MNEWILIIFNLLACLGYVSANSFKGQHTVLTFL